MNHCEFTASITALANLMAKDLNSNEIAILAVFFTQLGDTLASIDVVRNICSETNSKN